MTARMLLHALDSGHADRVAVLLHGMMGSAESWWRIAPLLERSGFRVIALDLPGHGLSPRDERCTVASAADDVIETVVAPLPPHGIAATPEILRGTDPHGANPRRDRPDFRSCAGIARVQSSIRLSSVRQIA